MKYKIILINYADEGLFPNIHTIDHRNGFQYSPSFEASIQAQWEKEEGWFALKKYGLHVFETDDLENFDLLEAQKRKDEPYRQIHFELETNKYIDTAPMELKAEIRRIAERLYQSESFNGLCNVISAARHFVDNFDAEFEKLEKFDKLMHYTEVSEGEK